MKPLTRALGASLLALGISTALQAKTEVSIPVESFTLPNGLTVLVHEDRKAPIVAVNLWYHVGSKDEQPGKTGFAHLFEHLMFQGSENFKGEFFEPFEKVGATEQNGTTNFDRTNYFQNVPTTAVDMALWMESDRMGHLLGAIDQGLLDEQRGVVQNEKRQGENQPYGRRVFTELFRNLYPEGHPYSWPVIGLMEDLDAASLDDVRQWFRTWYGPNNAVLVLAGDIDVQTAKAKVTRYFGDIPASASVPRLPTMIPERSERTRQVLGDRVPQTRIYRAWNTAQTGSQEATRLDLVAQILGGGKSSRLSERLVLKEKLADNVNVFQWSNQLSGNFMIITTIKEGVDVAKVEKILDEEIARFRQDGPTAEELEQARTVIKAGFLRGIERVGGFGGKSDVLASCQVFTSKPDCFEDELATMQAATPAVLTSSAKQWLGGGDHTLIIQPAEEALGAQPEKPFPTRSEDTGSERLLTPDPKFSVVKSDVDRSAGVPVTESFPDLSFPDLQRATLSNGIPVVLAERHEVPVVQLNMEFRGGYAADVGRKLGTSSFTMSMLDEGAGAYDAIGLSRRADSLGMQYGSGADLDGAEVYVSALKENLGPSLDLFADMVRRPTFPESEIDRVRATWIAGIKQEKTRPNSLALRLLPPLLYGDGHSYAMPFSGSGTEASIGALTRDELVDFHADFIRPDNATLVIVGDTTLKEIIPLLEQRLADWKAPAEKLEVPEIAKVAVPTASRVYLVDQPGATQANIFVGQLVPSTKADTALDFDIANGVLGGEFSSRLNMKLREEKQWAYGSYSFTQGALGQRPWVAFAPVQTDKTVESLAELKSVISGFASGSAAIEAAEADKIKLSNVRSLPGAYETAGSVMNQIGSILRYERPDNYVEVYKQRTESLSLEAVRAAAATIRPEALTWVVVGDLKTIEQPIRELGLGSVTIMDSDGKPAG